MSKIITRLRTVEAKLRAAGLTWMAARVSECIDRECVEPNIDELERVADMAEAQPRLEAENRQMREDAALLNVLRDECWDLRCFDVPTGGDDADVNWRVIGRWGDEPHARTIAEGYSDDPRVALRFARDTLASLPVQP